MRFFTSLSGQRRSVFIIITIVTGFLILWLILPLTIDTPLPVPYSLLSQNSLEDPSIPSHSNSRLLPFRYWHHRSLHPELYTDGACMKLPSVSDLKYAANSWQLLEVKNGSVYIYAAFWDARFEEPLVRILIYTDVYPVPKLFCQLWFPNDNEPQTELAEVTYAWQPAWGGPFQGVNEPYVLSCRCRRHKPEPEIAPIATAVVTEPCGVATNVLDVQNAPFKDPLDYRKIDQKPLNSTTVAVCLKWLHYREDISVSVIEWLQLLKNFGANKVYVYIVRTHHNTRKVLEHYESTGFVVLTEMSHPPQVSGLHSARGYHDFWDLRRELLPLNDCLYRNIGQHDWIASFDLDEMIVPAPEDNYAALIDKEMSEVKSAFPIDAIVFPNYFVLDGAQRDLVGPAKARILSHTWRARNPSPPGWCVKSFFNTSSVITMHNHMPMSCKNYCNTLDMLNKTGRLLHFRNKCADDEEDCEALHDVIRESILDRWRAPVLRDIEEVMTKLDLGSLE